MRIAIPAEDDKGLESKVSGHFGRAKYFVFVDVEENQIKGAEVVEVPSMNMPLEIYLTL